MEHTHINAPCPFAVAPLVICFQNQSKIFPVLLLPLFSHGFRVYPSIISRPGHPCCFTQHAYIQQIIFFLQGLLDGLKLPSGTHGFFLLEVFSPHSDFFRNSTSWRRYFTSFHTLSIPSGTRG